VGLIVGVNVRLIVGVNVRLIVGVIVGLFLGVIFGLCGTETWFIESSGTPLGARWYTP